ncbi:MAG: HlyC/CorC family transporter [Myxococcales bacterium]|nr:HlyC/CorC family transporter [Myxococcales bacterium]
MTQDILIILALLAMNGIFAMAELAIVTSRKVRLEQRAEEGSRGARAALAVARDPSRFLSTVQVGITLIGVLAGAFGGATIAEALVPTVERVSWLAPYAEAVAFGVVVTLITYLSLVIGELIPKRIALSHPEAVAAVIARPMQWLAIVAAPVVALLTGPTNLVLRLLGIRGGADPGLSEIELRALLEQGAESGAVNVNEHEIVESVFRLGDRQVADVMVPRVRLEWLDLDEGMPAVVQGIIDQAADRYLVCRGEVDQVAGIVYAADLARLCVQGTLTTLDPILVEPLFVPAGMPALDLLDRFKSSRRDVALALDEHGGVVGMVSIDDLVTAVVGDIPEEGQSAEPAIVRVDASTWNVDAQMLVTDAEEAIGQGSLLPAGGPHARTISGALMAVLGRIPVVGDALDLPSGASIRVLLMDGRAVRRVAITVPPRRAVPG